MGFTPKQLVLIFGMLLTGTINTVSKKLQLDCSSVGYFNYSANNTQTEHKFNKPWFQTLLMFLGETLCLFGFFIIRFKKRRRLERESAYREIDESERGGILNTPLFNWFFLLPAFCDLLGTTIAGIGLLFVDASIWQMMRGSLIIFAGILSIIFLKRRLRGYHWTGMCFTVVGLALVGTKSVFSGHSLDHSGAQSALGVALVLVGAFTSACQMIVEEVFIKNRGFHPLQAVGMEGLFGSLMMIVVALPAVHFIPGSDLNGSFENVLDALYQIVNNTLLLVNCILYILSIAFFNYFGLSITRYLSAVHRTLIDAMRTTFVWLVSLILYYSTNAQFGEPFEPAWGLIQIDGFACLIIGTLIYNKVMDLSFIRGCGDPPEDEKPILTVTADEPGVADGGETPILPDRTSETFKSTL
ncbi:Solute carrier family 35 member F6 [Fasciola gigantica]|uniref:Solute carrier family 35 member F6 n=1 Tax=Fasciola gigantica TaxID=46835 RepID=A0A504YP65_FASGI|nr:Solute carrier family 35 member F6 [Fasciola gigantica]